MEVRSRNPTEITIQILEVVNGYNDSNYDNNEGLTLTTLMNKLFLSPEQMKEYLVILIENGLLSYDSTMCKYKTTEKGFTLVRGYNQINKMLNEHQN